jgi:7-alpha-hydroxysteroid dehydrogenase
LTPAAHTQSNLEARAQELRQTGARALALATTLTDESQVHQLIERALNEYRRIDILVNLAGRPYPLQARSRTQPTIGTTN